MELNNNEKICYKFIDYDGKKQEYYVETLKDFDVTVGFNDIKDNNSAYNLRYYELGGSTKSHFLF